MDLLSPVEPPRGAEGVSGTAEKKRRGRPKGAKNKAAGDLLKWISHETQGLTPGQQDARLVMVTPKDVRLSKQWFKEYKEGTFKAGYGILRYKDHDPIEVAMSWKAERLAALNGWPSQDAWALLTKVNDGLKPYVHAKQGSVEPEVVDKRGVIYADTTPMGSLGNPSQAIDNQAELFYEPPPVTHSPSHTDE